MRIFKISVICALFVMATLLAGCAGSYQARNLELKDSPLVNPDILSKGEGDQALYRYVKPGLDIKSYKKVLIDQVIIYKDGELDKDALANYQTLANNAYVYLTRELEKDYKIVKSAEPGTLRIQWAIIDADSSKPVRNTLSTFVPVGIAISLVKLAATGKQSGVGEITIQMRGTDAVTGELLAAMLDRRVGGKDITELWSSWSNADDALKYWAKRVRFVMCKGRHESDCAKPE
ncbi:MAG: DUF3313 domain-containing protein [Deltaproteobacteria bacterium]|nr:DUF3313 domain-containing protein [Deltaproteobacteria bacterium]